MIPVIETTIPPRAAQTWKEMQVDLIKKAPFLYLIKFDASKAKGKRGAYPKHRKGSKARQGENDSVRRDCLKCHKTFYADGRFLRMCEECRKDS